MTVNKQGRPRLSKKGPRIKVTFSMDPDALKYLNKISNGNRSEYINRLLKVIKDSQRAVPK